MRNALEGKRAEEQDRIDHLLGDAEALREARDTKDDSYDEGAGGEASTIAVDRSGMLYRVQLMREAIDEINEALWRLDRGTFGMCSSCGDPIIKDRLRAYPSAPMCVPCKTGGILRTSAFQR
jgi:DnaK suppressor protein